MLSMAYGATGVENITLSTYSASIHPGGNVTLTYNLKKISGYYPNITDLYVVNNGFLSSRNISISLSTSYGNPPANGIMHISVSRDVYLGLYNITLAGNNTGTAVNQATLWLNIIAPVSGIAYTTTMSYTSNVSNALTSMPASTSVGAAVGSGPLDNSIYFVLAAVIIIIIISVLVFLKFRR